MLLEALKLYDEHEKGWSNLPFEYCWEMPEQVSGAGQTRDQGQGRTPSMMPLTALQVEERSAQALSCTWQGEVRTCRFPRA